MASARPNCLVFAKTYKQILKLRQNFWGAWTVITKILHTQLTYFVFNFVVAYFGPKIEAMLRKYVAVDTSGKIFILKTNSYGT